MILKDARRATVGDTVELGDTLYTVEVAEPDDICDICDNTIPDGDDAFVAEDDDFLMCRECAENDDSELPQVARKHWS